MDTTRTPHWAWGVVAVVALAALFLAGRMAPMSRAETGENRQLTWVITHKPITVFDRAKDVFVSEFNRDSDTKIAVTILGPDDFDTAAHRLGTKDVFEMMQGGEAQVGTITLNSVMQDVPEAAIFSLPYLFAGDAAVEAAFSGSVGQKILAKMTARFPVNAMAFTFSGGWLVIQSNTASFADASGFAGKKLTSINGGISLDVLASTGADVVELDIVNTSNREINESVSDYDGVETVLTRLHQMDTPKYLTRTDHALFVTAIVVDKNFAASLSARDKQALERAVAAAAAAERADSRQLAEDNLAGLKSRGTTVVELSAAERAELAAKMRGVYAKYESSVGKEAIEEARSLR